METLNQTTGVSTIRDVTQASTGDLMYVHNTPWSLKEMRIWAQSGFRGKKKKYLTDEMRFIEYIEI